MARIGIIGAGISGLTLAFLLKEKGHQVRVFETASGPGGAIRTTRTGDGWVAEWGPNTIIESSGRIKKLVSMLGLEKRRCYPDAAANKRYIVRGGKVIAVPGSFMELIRTPLLSPSAKMSILGEPFRRKAGYYRSVNAEKSNQGKALRNVPLDVSSGTSPANPLQAPLGSSPVESPADSLQGPRGGPVSDLPGRSTAGSLPGPGGGPVDESLADFVRRRLGDEFLKWPIDALVGGIYAGNPERLSVRHAFPRLALLEEQHGSLILGQIKGGIKRPPGSDEIPRNKAAIFSFDTGLQLLPETLSNHLGDSVIYGQRVVGVELIRTGKPKDGTMSGAELNSFKGQIRHDGDPHGTDTDRELWKINLAEPQHDAEKSAGPDNLFDAIVYAGTAFHLNEMHFPDSMARLLEPVTDIPHPPVVSLTLGFHRRDIEHKLDGFGMLIPGVEGYPILGTLFTSSLFPDRAPDAGHATLTSYLGGTRQPDIAEKDEDEQVRLVTSTLRKLIGLKGDPVFRHRACWPKAIPQYEIGFGRILDSMDRLEQEHHGFYLAGNYRSGISVGDTINAAFDLAGRIESELPHATRP